MDIDQIYNFLIEKQGVKRSELSPESDFRKDLGIEGDDFSELIESFAERYQVNMDSYLWYFHHREEGWNLGALFFKPPNEQVETIGICPQTLLEAAQSKKWPISYPSHQLIESRPDITFNKVLFVSIFVIGGLTWFLSKLGPNNATIAKPELQNFRWLLCVY